VAGLRKALANCLQSVKRLTVAEIAQEFLDDSKANNDPRTYDFYRYFVVPFVTRFGAALAATFPPLSFQKSIAVRDV
jgi:hypothetical protein